MSARGIRRLVSSLAPALLALCLLAGCSQSVPDRAALDNDGAIRRISFMRIDGGEYSFSYSIYQLGEAYYFAGELSGAGDLGSREVTQADMTRARELAAQYGLKAYLEAYKPPLIKLPSGDAHYRTELELDDGQILSADTDGTWGEALMSFFAELELASAGEESK